uniref:Uncharacterized protein n=1 Tax=Arundo donax TaxID=35708 RepID=A0A0A9HSY5_ARUDO
MLPPSFFKLLSLASFPCSKWHK